METKGSLPHSQEPATCPYSKPITPVHSPAPLNEDTFQYCPPIYAWVFQVVLSLMFSHQNPAYASLPPFALYAPPISFFWNLSLEQYALRSTDHKAPHYVVFSTPLLPRPSSAQIFSSTPYFQTPSVCVPPSMWSTMFHIYTKQKCHVYSIKIPNNIILQLICNSYH
jgi:hypothetical protein